jgi:glycolate oxidase subunit GlcD
LDVLKNLIDLFGVEAVLTDNDSLQHYGKDWTKTHQPDPLAIVFPHTTQQVQALVKLANKGAFTLVPSGGRTGLSGGAVAANKEVVVAFDRMNKILAFNAIDRSLTCEPGAITQQIQQLAKDNNLLYPVDFASSASSQIGGNIATNAGGIKVVRYGLTRNWVLGLKVVTGSGEILDLNKGLVKNATGYDLRHLFIGSEGTLGFITEATLRLTKPPKNLCVMVLGINDVTGLMKVFKDFQNTLDISAFECFSDRTLHYVHTDKGIPLPFETRAPYYALLEFDNDSEQRQDEAFQTFENCINEGWVVDGVMSQSESQAQSLWRLREDISETLSAHTPYKNDLSVKISVIPEFLEAVVELITHNYTEFEVLWYGHIGDGNIHLNILKPEKMQSEEFFKKCKLLNPMIFELTQQMNGSISAEHGVGLLKRDDLAYSRSKEELTIMRQLKAVFDPNGIMNPGKMLSDPQQTLI